MATISSLVVSDALPPRERTEEVESPTTPRPGGRTPAEAADQSSDVAMLDASLVPEPSVSSVTEARSTASQTQAPVPASQDESRPSTAHSDAARSRTVDLDGEDNDMNAGAGATTDNENEQGEAESASRKKKGQRFFCTGYPPCNLSFTRSEHLARHIRKHTGERPFQCHCNRRFSRLDNLRQHAQTVHVNEEIPTDSLAATGTRFQRQIRTDRVRSTGRPRTTGTMATASSTGGHSRGHSRNLSASSVGSTSSNYSIVTEAKRRPPPLLMANNDNLHRPAGPGPEPPRTPPPQYRGFSSNSPSSLSTPTSANFSATPGSPLYGSSMGSPVSTNARLAGFYGSRTPGRRLSVPSGPNPYQQQYAAANAYPPPYMTPIASSGSHASSASNGFPSPTSSNFSVGPAHHVPPGEDWRRRTWHPSTYTAASFNYGRPATSGLTYSQTPDAPQPAYAPHATAAAAQAPRLPGIESFDHVQHRPSTPPRRQPSPMQMDSVHPDTHFASPVSGQDVRPRPGHVSWEGPRPSHYPELDGHGGERTSAPISWGQQTMNELQRVGLRQHEDPARPVDMAPPLPFGTTPPQHQHMAREALQMQQSSVTPTKRQGWYNGPLPPPARTSPEDSSSSDGVPTPGTTAMEVHPVIMPSSGYIEPQHPAIPPDGHQNVSHRRSLGLMGPFADMAITGLSRSSGPGRVSLHGPLGGATPDRLLQRPGEWCR